MVLFASDIHFGHENIINYCKRPYANVAEMDRSLIDNWNRKVKKNDTVYIMGDLVWNKKLLAEYMGELAGKKILIVGNHDADWCRREDCKKHFESVTPYLETHLNCHPVTMCHYPMLEWMSSREDTPRKLGYHIHGHIHNNVREEYKALYLRFNALNAGVDVNNYEPVTFEELIENNMRFKLSVLESEEEREMLLRHRRELGQ